jgi:hypothetical protein
VQEVEEVSREARQYSQRRLTYFHDQDGSLVVKLQLPAESGALFLKALDAALADVPLPERDEAPTSNATVHPASMIINQGFTWPRERRRRRTTHATCRDSRSAADRRVGPRGVRMRWS